MSNSINRTQPPHTASKMPTRPTRHLFNLTIGQLRALKTAGFIRPAPVNRDVINDENRPRGTCEGYWASVRYGENLGQMLGYSLADCADFKECVCTLVFAGTAVIFVTDFGHRFDWLTRDETSIVFPDGETLATLRTTDPTEYASIMELPLGVSVATHADKAFLEKTFSKKEYFDVNTNATPLEGGELARGLPQNATREEAEVLAKSLIDQFFPETPKERDNRRLLELGLVSGAAKSTDKFHRKTDDLLAVAVDPLSPEEVQIACDTLRAMADAEADVLRSLEHVPSPSIKRTEEEVEHLRSARDTSPRGAKREAAAALKEAEKYLKALKKEDKALAGEKEKQKALLSSRSMEHKFTGPVLYGFRTAVLADRARADGLTTETDAAKLVFRRWMLMSVVGKTVWSANKKDVCSRYGENNSARYYNETRFKAGWTRMQTMLPTA